MARADLIKRVFESYKRRDDNEFRAAAMEIVEEERKKRHTVLANDLQKILNGVERPMSNINIDLTRNLAPLPKDSDRGIPLLDIRFPKRNMKSMVLNKTQLSIISNVMTEFREWDVLAAYGLSPSKRMLFFGPPGLWQDGDC